MPEFLTRPSFLFDAVCFIVLLVVCFLYAHRGFASALVHLLGMLISVVGGAVVSNYAAPVLFDTFMANPLQQRVSNTIAESGTVDVSSLAEKYAGFMPSALIDSVVRSAQETIDAAVAENAPNLAEQIVQQLLRPLLVPVIGIVLFFILFILVRMIFDLLSGLLVHLNKVPLVGSVNYWLGFVTGIFAGILAVFLIMCAVWAVMVVTGGSLPYLNEETLSSSFVYQAFSGANPFLL